MIQPASTEELVELVRCQKQRRILAVGSRTKDRLSVTDDSEIVSLSELTGISNYEPAEFTFTALAGTRINEVESTLAKHQQYLPFDPILSAAGATLGGTVASGISGPGRFRYGGIRDFLIGVRFISGDGQLITGGGKVVKNAAGFDLPKLMVGSLGRLGVLVELTFKVFPRHQTFQTIKLCCADDQQAIDRITQLCVSQWELDALDYRPNEKSIYLRVGAANAVAVEFAEQIVVALGRDATILDTDEAAAFWNELAECRWAVGALVKVPTTIKCLGELLAKLTAVEGVEIHVSAGGAVVWVSACEANQLVDVDGVLTQMDLSGLVVRGESSSMWLGQRRNRLSDESIKKAFDPKGRFECL